MFAFAIACTAAAADLALNEAPNEAPNEVANAEHARPRHAAIVTVTVTVTVTAAARPPAARTVLFRQTPASSRSASRTCAAISYERTRAP